MAALIKEDIVWGWLTGQGVTPLLSWWEAGGTQADMEARNMVLER